MGAKDEENYAKYAEELANLSVDKNAIANIEKANSYANLTIAERNAMTTAEKIALVKAEREGRMTAAMQERAASNPMYDPSVRPEAPPAENGMLYYYGWSGGATTGQWALRRAPATSENIGMYGALAFGGPTQQQGLSSFGANALASQPQPILNQFGEVIGYELNGKRINQKFTSDSSDGSDNFDSSGNLLVDGTSYNNTLYSKLGTDTANKTSDYGQGSSGYADRKSAYDTLYNEFKKYGLESLVEEIKNLITSNTSPSGFSIALQNTEAYKKRFAKQ